MPQATFFYSKYMIIFGQYRTILRPY